MKLAVITGTSRPGRQTPRQSKWIVNIANAIKGVDAEHVDLKDYPLPYINETISPRYNLERDVDSAVQKWLDKLNEFDAYIFVTPEYNHSIPGELKNAFDYLTWELKHKPTAIASHGVYGGVRAAAHLRTILSEGQSVPIPQFSAIAHMSNIIDEDGKLSKDVKANPYGPQSQLEKLLSELKWYSDALGAARNQEAAKELAVVA